MFPAISQPPALQSRWTKVSGGEALAVDLATVKTFVNRALEDDTWDDELTRFTRVAQQAIEKEAEIFLTPGVWRGTLPAFLDAFWILRRPFVSVDSIEYVDTSGEIITLAADQYQVGFADQDCGIVYRGESVVWPYTARRLDAVRITVKAGFACLQDDIDLGYPPLPEDVQHALLMTIASMDQARGDMAASSDATVYAMKASKKAGAVPQEAKTLLAHYKYWQVTV